MPQLQLIDEKTGATYLFNLTEDKWARASTDLVYSTQLLAKVKATSEENYCNAEEEEASVGEAYNDGFRWIDETVRLLLAAYKQHEDLLNTGKVSVKKFWEIIFQILKEKSYNITGLQCKSKLNGLKKTYKSVKDYNSKSGNNRPTWPYFEIMDEIFGHKPWVTPVPTLDTSKSLLPPPTSPTSNCSSNSSVSRLSSPCTSEGPRKRQKVNEETVLEKFLTIVQESKEERRKMHKDTVIRQDRLLTLLEKIANKK